MKYHFLTLIHKFFKYSFVKKNIFYDYKNEELSFVVVITSYNNKNYFEQNLKSVLSQDYVNYKVIYIDDCSKDGNEILVEQFIMDHDKQNKISLIKNTERKKKLFNLYNVISSLSDEQIVIELDGDDYFANNNVLKTFNAYYQKTKALLVHANYLNNPKDLAKELKLETYSNQTPCFVIKYNLFREYPWIYSGIRSYYAGLFKKIHKNDLLFKQSNNESFYPVCHDMAMFFPMLEMAGNRIAYIPEPLLLRNIDSPINDFKSYENEFRINIMKEIRSAQKYKRISQLF